jgi:drug/metabolite transporter (DMT)-like permease
MGIAAVIFLYAIGKLPSLADLRDPVELSSIVVFSVCSPLFVLSAVAGKSSVAATLLASCGLWAALFGYFLKLGPATRFFWVRQLGALLLLVGINYFSAQTVPALALVFGCLNGMAFGAFTVLQSMRPKDKAASNVVAGCLAATVWAALLVVFNQGSNRDLDDLRSWFAAAGGGLCISLGFLFLLSVVRVIKPQTIALVHVAEIPLGLFFLAVFIGELPTVGAGICAGLLLLLTMWELLESRGTSKIA